METLLVCCETIRDEVIQAMARLGLGYSVRFLEGGLHQSPERLFGRLRGVLSEADGVCGRLLLALGWCGGGLEGLTTGAYETVVPLTDDCLTFLMGSRAARLEASRPATYFLTRGWLRHENSAVREHERIRTLFSTETAALISRTIFAGYQRLGFLDTGAYSLEEAEADVGRMAEELELDIARLKTDPSWLEELLTGPHDDPSRFLRLPPGSRLSLARWRLIFSRRGGIEPEGK
ncbi:MAG: DUF1638 domain-containing protein [Deltaproteobacteria bacterium]|jgi:hypothetical protein|nr:DUF1638 domain-containing protein [Deltaproteobacteria bacterium]